MNAYLKITVWGLALLGLMAATGGCGRAVGQRDDPGLVGGIHLPQWARGSRAEYRIHAELVSDAHLVRQDTTPQWQLGRYGHLPGDDDVLVVTRITSFPRDGELVDVIFERAWIAIPATTEAGDVIRIRDLEQQRRVGYDRYQLNEPGYFVQPARIFGTVSIIEEREDTLELAVDIKVQPRRKMPPWQVTELYALAHHAEPVYATAANPARVASVHREPRPDWTSLFEPPADEQPTERIPRGNGTAGPPPNGGEPPQPPVDDQQGGREAIDDEQQVAPTEDDDEGVERGQRQQEPQRTVLGRWIGQTDRFQLRLQFDDDGTFIFASTRGGGNYAPGIRKGTYRIDGNWVTMHVESYTFEGQPQTTFFRNQHLRDMNLQKKWENGRLRLEGNYLDREGHMDVLYHRADFPDMNNVLPPRGWVDFDFDDDEGVQ